MTEGGHLLAIDAGGSSVKASVVSLDDGHAVSLGRVGYRVDHPLPGQAEFDPRVWWEAIVGAARRAVATASAVAIDAVVCTGMRIPFVLVDGTGREIRPGILNHDRRGAEMLDAVRAAGGSRLYARTGHWPAPEFGLGKLAWLARHEPQQLAVAASILQFHDWIVFRLCGSIASEPSSAAMSGALDLETGTWAADLLSAVGVDPSLFPALVPSGTPVGGVRPDVADAIGLQPGTPVLAGAGDTHMSCLGIGNASPGQITVVAGSTTPVMLATSEPALDLEICPLVSPHVQSGVFAAETNAGATGIRYTWLRALAGELRDSAIGYDALDALAGGSPTGARGLTAIAGDPGWGERAWASAPPGGLHDLTPSHSAGDVARAILEGSAIATAAQIDRLATIAPTDVTAVRVTGGTSRSALWCQLLADASRRTVEVVAVDEPSSRAAAIVALGDRGALAPVACTTYESEPGASEELAEVAQRYRSRFDALRAIAW